MNRPDATPSPAAHAAAPAAKRPSILAVTSGKGGVGKTFVTANLAAALTRRGERVLVLDADLGLANLDVVLNLYPKITLHDVFTDKASLEDAIVPAPGGYSVLLAGSGMVEYSRLTPELRNRLLGVIQTVAPRFDRILLDTGAGISYVVLFAISLADEVALVVTSEPTSLADAYATVKVLSSQQQRGAIRLIVNQVSQLGEARTVRAQLQRVVDRFVNPGAERGVTLDLVGAVPADKTVREAVQKRQLLLEIYPGSPAALAVNAIATHLAP